MGIGGATARRLASDGARVLIADIEEQAANRNAQTIQAAGGTAEVIVADVSSLDGVRSTIERAVERWGRLDIVVNNAYSGVYRGSAVDLPEEHWDRGFDIGLKAMYRAAKYAVPHLRQSGSGSIVNLSSVHGMLVASGALVYETVKSAVIGLTRQLAAEYGPDNIRVNAICPGHIVTERIQPQWQAHPEGLRFFEEHYPLRRCGKPEDIANAIAFLCSEDASFITGQALVVDGGMTLQLQENLAVHVGHYTQEHPETWLPY
jgi:NAD(P)-dependent dehydrogenase (short-subunit alcohol dehydrogenase family)